MLITLFFGTNAGRLTTSGINNSAFGSYALYSHTTGHRNSAFGHQALYSTTTGYYNAANGAHTLYSNTGGTYNTAMGASALYYSNGNNNTACGAVALFYNTSGSYNVALGAHASARNTTGNNNNSLGFQSLYWNTTGSNNVSIGHQALYSNTTASQNTATGYQALYLNTTGNQNTAYGYEALYSNTSSTANTAIGWYALRYNTGQFNTATGHWALGLNSTGNYNTANGKGSLYNNTTGFYNVAFGGDALDDNQTGSNNTAIGYNAGPNSNAYSNTTALGSNAVITASNQVRVGNASVTSIGGAVNFVAVSDKRFKMDIKEDVSGLNFINELRPVSFTLDRKALSKFLGTPDSIISKQEFKLDRQTGFIAQEVEEAIDKGGFGFHGVEVPQNEKDLYGIRYAEFVVPLVKAVQELSSKVEEQQRTIDFLLTKNDSLKSENESHNSNGSILYPNNPNPFSIDTQIKMTLSETTEHASLIVYNLEGKELKTIQVSGRGDTAITISANEFSAGMYLYALIVDGKIIDTKRMILTK